MIDTVDRYAGAHRRYGLFDGTGEMEFGIGCLFFAAIIWLSRATTVTWLWFAGMLTGIGILWAVNHFGMRYIRQRWVYARSGYVKMRKRPWALVLVMLMSAALTAALALLFAEAGSSAPSPALIHGSLIGLALLAGALLKSVKRFAIYAAVSMAIGILLQLIDPNLRSGLIWYYALMGIVCLSAGILTLHFYARRTPERDTEAE